MSRRILGVELDARSAVVVEVREGWRRYVLERYLCLDLPADSADEKGWAEARDALQGWVGARRRPFLVAAGFPGTDGFSALLHFPFRRVSQIHQLIKSEMESHMPLAAEEAVADFVPQPRSPRKGMEVLGVAASKAALSRHLEMLAGLGVFPDRLDFAPLADLRACRALLPDCGKSTVGVVKVSDAHVSFSLSVRGCPAYIRTFRIRPYGGARAPGLLPGGEPLLAGAGGSDESRREWFLSLARDLRFTLQSLAEQLDAEAAPGQLVLTGGGANLSDLSAFLERELEIPCHPISRASSAAVSGKDFPFTEDLGRISGALGAALGSATRLREGFNLRRDEFAPQRGWREFRRPVIAAGLAAVFACGVGVADLSLKIRRDERRLEALETDVRSHFHKIFPEAKAVSNPERQVMLRIQDQARRLELLQGSSLNGSTPLELMAKISQAVPPSLKVRLNLLEFDEGGMSVRGETLSFEAVDQIKSLLARMKGFEGLELRNAHLLTGEKGVQFHMRVRFNGTNAGRGR